MTETRRRGWHTVKVRREGQSSLFNLPPPICLPLYSPWARVTHFPILYDTLTIPTTETCLKGKHPILFQLYVVNARFWYIYQVKTQSNCVTDWAHVSREIIPVIRTEPVLRLHCLRLHVMALIRQCVQNKDMLPSWKACFTKEIVTDGK